MARRVTRPDFGIPDSHPLHPKWGRTLNDYTTSYDIEEMKRRLVVTEGMLAKAQEAMTCICDEGEEERVTPSMLQSVLVLAQSPLTFRYFSKPDLIKGCLRLMATVKRQAEPSPFSHEFGYFCFKILVISFGVILLERTDNLKMTIDNMAADAEADLLTVLSGHVSRVVQNQIDLARGECVLGWAVSSDHARQEMLVSQSYTLLLLKLLWNDKECFLSAFSCRIAHPIGLSGILFLLWRCIRSELPVTNTSNADRLIIPFCDILWRYALVAPIHQLGPVMLINNDISPKAHIWDKSPKPVDPAEARIVTQAYIKRLTPADPHVIEEMKATMPAGYIPHMYTPMSLSGILALLRFVTPFVGSNMDSVASVISATVPRMWVTPTGWGGRTQKGMREFEGILRYLTNLMEQSDPNNVSSFLSMGTPTPDEIAVSTFNGPLVDILGQVILKIEPPQPNDYAELASITGLCAAIRSFFESVAKTAPWNLEKAFRLSLPAWLKCKNQLLFIIHCTDVGQSEVGYEHYRRCYNLWGDLIRILHLELFAHREDKVLRPRCSYARCPDPDSICGAKYTCNGCLNPKYCNLRCQTGDWTGLGGSQSHQQNCPQDV